MGIISLDFETFYSQQYSLSKMTTQEYVLGEEFEVIGVSVLVDNQEPVWFSGTMQETKKFLDQFDWGNSALLCQNTMFDAAILAWHFDIHPKILLDTLAMSRALFPHEKSHSLKAQAERMGVGVKGTEVLNAIGKHRKDFTDRELAAYGEYCINDADLTLKLAKLYLPRMSKTEVKLIDATLRCYTQPQLLLDKAVLEEHLKNVKVEKAILLDKVRFMLDVEDDISDADLSRILASNNKFASVLETFGVEPPKKISPTTGKSTYAFAKTDEAFKALEEHEDPNVQALVSARLGTKSTIEETRTQRLIDCAGLARELPIALRYYGAWTGRWSGDSAGAINMQNLPRKSPMKRAIVAPKGQVICGADLSNIELRLGLWLAGQEDKVQLIRDGLDLYKDLASRTNDIAYEDVPDDMRQTFKVVNLSAIYATGAARLQSTLRIMAGQKVKLDNAQNMINAYRQDNPQVVAAWEACHEALLAIANQAKAGPKPLFRGLVTWDAEVQGFTLPSGLHLQIPNLRIERSDTGKKQFVFDGRHGPERTYGGKLFQGLTQAIARCIIAQGWLRIHKQVPVALSVHDSLYWLADEADAERSLLWGLGEMVKPISWCASLPLGAEGAFGTSIKGGSKVYKV